MENNEPTSIEEHFNKYWREEGVRLLTGNGIPNIEDRVKDAYFHGFFEGVNALKEYISKKVEQ